MIGAGEMVSVGNLMAELKVKKKAQAAFVKQMGERVAQRVPHGKGFACFVTSESAERIRQKHVELRNPDPPFVRPASAALVGADRLLAEMFGLRNAQAVAIQSQSAIIERALHEVLTLRKELAELRLDLSHWGVTSK